jgi:hypothetical protein
LEAFNRIFVLHITSFSVFPHPDLDPDPAMDPHSMVAWIRKKWKQLKLKKKADEKRHN